MYGCPAIGLPMVVTTSGLRDAGRVLRITALHGVAADGIMTAVAGATAKATGLMLRMRSMTTTAMPMATTKKKNMAITITTKRIAILLEI